MTTSKYILYARKSSESEERQVLSIESQVKEVKAMAQRLGINVTEVLMESQSAKRPGRPIFNGLVKRIYSGEFKGVLTWKLDRLARNPIDGSSVVWAFDEGKLSEIITPHGTFYNNSSDKFLMQIEFGIAKKYVDDLSDNVKRGNRAKLEKGWLPGLAPLGYLNEPRERTIVPDPERFLQVRRMWDLLIEGKRVSEIAMIANEQWGFRMRVFRKQNREKISVNSLYKIFNNTFYYGLLERPEGTFQGKHEPMITEEEYWQAQDILGSHGRPRPKKHTFAFTGLIRCGECGAMITAEGHTNRYGYHYTYYRCTKKKSKCSQKYVCDTDLDNSIVEILKHITIPKRFVDSAVKQLKRLQEMDSENNDMTTDSLSKALFGCKKKLENLNQMRLRDLIGDDEYLEEKKRLLGEKAIIEKNLSGGKEVTQKVFEQAAATFIFAGSALERFNKGALEDKRTVFKGLGSNFLLKDKKLTIQIEKPFVIIGNAISSLKARNDWLELSENKTVAEPIAVGGDVFQFWCAGKDSNLRSHKGVRFTV